MYSKAVIEGKPKVPPVVSASNKAVTEGNPREVSTVVSASGRGGGTQQHQQRVEGGKGQGVGLGGRTGQRVGTNHQIV